MSEAEKLAKKFHEIYERRAPEFSYETREASAVPWEDVPEKNKQLMIAVCTEILAEDKSVLDIINEEAGEDKSTRACIFRAVRRIRIKDTKRIKELEKQVKELEEWSTEAEKQIKGLEDMV